MVPELNVQPLFLYIHVSMDHKTSHMGQFYEIEIYKPEYGCHHDEINSFASETW